MGQARKGISEQSKFSVNLKLSVAYFVMILALPGEGGPFSLNGVDQSYCRAHQLIGPHFGGTPWAK